MTIYLDSSDSFYSIDHEPKTKPNKKDNDRTIGIISIIVLTAFAIYIISTIVNARWNIPFYFLTFNIISLIA